MNMIDVILKHASDYVNDVDDFFVVARTGNKYFHVTKTTERGFLDLIGQYMLQEEKLIPLIKKALIAAEATLICKSLNLKPEEFMGFVHQCDPSNPEKLTKEVEDFLKKHNLN